MTVDQHERSPIKGVEDFEYLMESEDEAIRLDLKTDIETVKKQAWWAGIKPGMSVADICCGSGKTTFILHQLAQPGGITVGIDGSEDRIKYAKEKYGGKGIEFRCKNILEPFDEIEMFDFVWVRFALEYYLSNSFDVVKNISSVVKPGGILCLIDLDYNCLTHYGLSEKLEGTLLGLMKDLREKANFDPYAGRKIYSYLYKLGYQKIYVDVGAHHLIFGELSDVNAFNWAKKIEVASRRVNYQFQRYEGGYEEFLKEFKGFFSDPGRFTYTPIILCRGHKPLC